MRTAKEKKKKTERTERERETHSFCCYYLIWLSKPVGNIRLEQLLFQPNSVLVNELRSGKKKYIMRITHPYQRYNGAERRVMSNLSVSGFFFQ